MTHRALVSCSDKSGIEPFIQGLVDLGFEIVSTGGTRKFLTDAGIPVVDVADYTGFPEMMDGRVKTLHPLVHGAILGRPDLPSDAKSMIEHRIIPFQIVVCNLYPFVETISRPGTTREEAIENIDIGGPSMIRSAAKNHQYVAIATSAEQYPAILEDLRRDGEVSVDLKRRLAAAAFEMTARYDRAITDYLAAEQTTGASADVDNEAFPTRLTLNYDRRQQLRYGENPHQRAAFYVESAVPSGTLAAAEQLHGKELSYNNLLDLDAALNLVREFDEPAAAVLKHNNPCGCAIADELSAAFRAAYAGDPVSAFGSIIGFNREVDAATAEELCEPNRFVEAIIAPGFREEALTILTTKPKWKANVRLLQNPGMIASRPLTCDIRRVTGGLLVQDRDETPLDETDWKVVTKRTPTDTELRDLRFAWLVCKHVKSNAIVFARHGAVTGVGAGQMSRLDSAMIAARKSEDRCREGVVASDAFFPFRDGIDQAAESGILAAIQPGGSRRDDEVIAAANEHGMAMIFTGRRHFRH